MYSVAHVESQTGFGLRAFFLGSNEKTVRDTQGVLEELVKYALKGNPVGTVTLEF